MKVGWTGLVDGWAQGWERKGGAKDDVKICDPSDWQDGVPCDVPGGLWVTREHQELSLGSLKLRPIRPPRGHEGRSAQGNLRVNQHINGIQTQETG